MVHYTQILLLAATIMAPVTQVFAADVDESWVTPGFVKCVDGLGGKKTRDAVYNCHLQHKTGKRAVEYNATTYDLNFFDARAYGSGDAKWTADCTSNSLPKNFEIVTNIRGSASEYCQDLKQGVLDAGVALIDKKLNNAVSKTLQELHGSKGVLLRMAFTLSPQGRALMTSKKVTEETYLDICTKAMTALATKDEGCTKDLHAYNSAKAKGYQVTGAKNGGMDISIGDQIFGFVTNMYTKP